MNTVSERINLEAKKCILSYLRGEELPLDLSYAVGIKVFNFEQNLLNYFGTNAIESNIRNYSEVAIMFLEKTFPICFETRSDKTSIKLDEALDSIVSENGLGDVPILN